MAVGKRKSRAEIGRLGQLLTKPHGQPWPTLHRAHTRLAVKDLYTTDHADQSRGGGFRWLMSTCLAATVGAIAILVVIFGSSDPHETPDGLLPALRRMSDAAAATPAGLEGLKQRHDGLRWLVPRTDRLQITSGAMSTRYTIHEMVRQRVAGRDKIYAKRYVRIVSRLTPVPPNYSDVIPPFNPLKLFASSKTTLSTESDGESGTRSDVSIKVVELLGGFLPEEDGQEFAPGEVAELVERNEPATGIAASLGAQAAADGGALASGAAPAADLAQTQNVSNLAKSSFDQQGDALGGEVGRTIVAKVGPGDTLGKILVASGAQKWQAAAMTEAARKIMPEGELSPGSEIEITLVPSLTNPGTSEPVRFSVYATSSGAKEHKVSVSRDAAGDYEASASHIAKAGEQPQQQANKLYSSVYYASLLQQIPQETILTSLRVHATGTDFSRPIRAGDQIELFFDPKDDTAPDGTPGDLLFTAITAGGETKRFYRFRASDGSVDFYDAQGNNSRRFLTRKPVPGDDIRLTSGYGMRRHPLLGEYKMHTGIDWSAPTGTEILAAGNGTIEEIGRKGYNGNYTRIRHANGYQTAYSHQSRFAAGLEAGSKVRQGQVIGYVGSTGLSSGPHLHFEILVNGGFVNPMSISDLSERQLSAKDLEEFKRERARIDDLMRRAPVKTEMMAAR